MALLIADYTTDWPEQFIRMARELRRVLGGSALRIDHIGSTAVPGLAAKPIIDLQLSVAELEPVSAYRERIESCGFAWRSDNPERTKRYFREVPPRPRTHLHVRRAAASPNSSRCCSATISGPIPPGRMRTPG